MTIHPELIAFQGWKIDMFFAANATIFTGCLP